MVLFCATNFEAAATSVATARTNGSMASRSIVQHVVPELGQYAIRQALMLNSSNVHNACFQAV